jgi:hypothetical protein
LPAILVGKLLLSSTLDAGVLQFFDPIQIPQNKTIQVQYKAFLANDPMPIKEFLDDWDGDYNPKNGQNIALLDSRFDLGGGVGSYYYLGYFHQYDLFIDTDKDFTDLFYSVKNKNDLEIGREYALDLDIEGIKQHGLIFSGDRKVYETDNYSISFGGAIYLSYGLDMQNGFISGKATANGTKDYVIDASSSYYYTHNYLYDLVVSSASGYGYGSHIGLYFENKKHNFQIKFLVNDLVSKMYWKDLPFSEILLKTENKSHDEKGYVKYAPTISGLEQYRDYTQTLESKYKLEGSVILEDSTIFGGIDFVHGENFPYVRIFHKLDEIQTLEFMHESHFGSFGFVYGYKNFKIGIEADEFSDNSSFGLNSSFIFRF